MSLACDVWYIDAACGLGLRILAITVLKVLRRADVQVNPKSTMANLDDLRRGDIWPGGSLPPPNEVFRR